MGGDGDGGSKFPGTLQPPNPARFLGSIPPNQALSEEEGMNQGRTSEESAPVMGLRPKQRWALSHGFSHDPKTKHHPSQGFLSSQHSMATSSPQNSPERGGPPCLPPRKVSCYHIRGQHVRLRHTCKHCWPVGTASSVALAMPGLCTSMTGSGWWALAQH